MMLKACREARNEAFIYILMERTLEPLECNVGTCERVGTVTRLFQLVTERVPRRRNWQPSCSVGATDENLA